jgi:Fatty acid hydroxylase superfamily
MFAVVDSKGTSIARGRVIKRVNALTAALCGALPAVTLGISFPNTFGKWFVGFVAGLLWANWFEYAYHRFLLHLPGTFFARRHLEHHASVGTPTEAEHVNFGSSPVWVAALFAINGLPMLALNFALRLGMAPGILLAFTAYYIAVEEIHWRIHLGEWLPRGLRAASAHHLAHHTHPNARFNIFLPLWDTLLGPAGD